MEKNDSEYFYIFYIWNLFIFSSNKKNCLNFKSVKYWMGMAYIQTAIYYQHVCISSENDPFFNLIQLFPQAFILGCHCNAYLMNMHWSYPFIAVKWNTFPGTSLGSVFCSYLVFQAIWHFKHLDADYSLALSLTLDAYLYLFFLQKPGTLIQ